MKLSKLVNHEDLKDGNINNNRRKLISVSHVTPDMEAITAAANSKRKIANP